MRQLINLFALVLLISVPILIINYMNNRSIEDDTVQVDTNIVENVAVVCDVPMVEEVIIEPEVYFDNYYDHIIYYAAKDTAVDPYLAIAISRLETGTRSGLHTHWFGSGERLADRRRIGGL